MCALEQQPPRDGLELAVVTQERGLLDGYLVDQPLDDLRAAERVCREPQEAKRVEARLDTPECRAQGRLLAGLERDPGLGAQEPGDLAQQRLGPGRARPPACDGSCRSS